MKNKWISFLVLLLTSAWVAAQPILVDKVIAVVGDNVVLQSDVEGQFQQMKVQGDAELPPNVRCEIFDNLLLDKLFLSQAQLDSIVNTPDEIEAELNRRIKYFISIFGSQEKLEEYYGKSLLELKDDFKDDIDKQLITDKMKGKVFSGLKVSPAEVREYFNRIPKDSIPYFNSELELGEIVMYPKISELEKERTKKRINDLRKDILEGADFSLKAYAFSEDPGSATEFGKLGWVERGELVPEFEAVAFRLKEGELSEPVQTPFGYHLIIVDEKRGNKLNLRHILIKPKIAAQDLTLVKNRMDSILHELTVDSLSWREAVNQYSEEEQSKSVGGMMTNPKNGTAFFEKADIEGTLIFTIDQMKVGQYSAVLPYSTQNKQTGEMTSGYRIIWLKSETKPHQASLELDYPKIQNAAKSEKQQKLLEEWVALHKDRNYIRIDGSMMNCEQVGKWVKKNNN